MSKLLVSYFFRQQRFWVVGRSRRIRYLPSALLALTLTGCGGSLSGNDTEAALKGQIANDEIQMQRVVGRAAAMMNAMAPEAEETRKIRSTHLTPIAVQILCGAPGREDAPSLSVGREISAALDAEVARGATIQQATERLAKTYCGERFVKLEQAV